MLKSSKINRLLGIALIVMLLGVIYGCSNQITEANHSEQPQITMTQMSGDEHQELWVLNKDGLKFKDIAEIRAFLENYNDLFYKDGILDKELLGQFLSEHVGDYIIITDEDEIPKILETILICCRITYPDGSSTTIFIVLQR